jgi:hypothetical protein
VTESEIRDLLRDVALRLTGYSTGDKANAWARGVMDGHALANPTVPLERMTPKEIEAFAIKAAER